MPSLGRLRSAGICALLCAIGLTQAACGPTVAQAQMDRLSVGMNAGASRMAACAAEIASNPNYAPLAAHIPLANAASPTLEQKADQGIPSVQDVQILFAWHKDIERCRTIAIDAFRQTTPAAEPILTDAYFKADQVMLKLVQRRITWGEANQRKAAIAAAYKPETLQVIREMTSQLAVAHQQEMAQRAALAGAIAEAVSEVAVEAALRRRH